MRSLGASPLWTCGRAHPTRASGGTVQTRCTGAARRARMHGVHAQAGQPGARVRCRDLVSQGVPITPRILERALACMMLNVARKERARTPAVAAPPLGGVGTGAPDPALTVIARLDGRFDPRAYKYIEDAAVDGRLPSTAVALGGRSIDVRGLLPATAEAFVLQLFNTMFRHLRGEGAIGGGVAAGPSGRTVGALALIVPPFRPLLVNMPSNRAERLAALHGTGAAASPARPSHWAATWDGAASTSDEDSDDSAAERVRCPAACTPCTLPLRMRMHAREPMCGHHERAAAGSCGGPLGCGCAGCWSGAACGARGPRSRKRIAQPQGALHPRGGRRRSCGGRR
jgi:hypothetical protein